MKSIKVNRKLEIMVQSKDCNQRKSIISNYYQCAENTYKGMYK